jgi:hypothetical protein
MMIASKGVFLLSLGCSAAAFTVVPTSFIQPNLKSSTELQGYLDDLSKDLNAPDATPDVYAESKEVTDMSKDQIDRYGPGDFSQFVDFQEFDGGDGRKSLATLIASVVLLLACASMLQRRKSRYQKSMSLYNAHLFFDSLSVS